MSQNGNKPPGTTTWDRSITELGTEMRSYYGRPVIKEPVWQPVIPWYFFTGGLAGASSVLGFVARKRGNDELADASMLLAFGADVVSPILLIADLGRPERFLNMFRVFKVTSPMSVGSWILGLSGATKSAGVGADLLGWTRARSFFEAVSAALGPPLVSYTGALIADTAVPVWHDARHELPFIFGAGGAASAGAGAALVTSPRNAGPARRLAIASAVTETALTKLMEKRLGFVGEVYHEDRAGTYGKLAKALTVAGAAVLGLAGRRRVGAVAGSSLVLAGTACMRWSIFKAGFQSAADPRYTVEPQRARAERDGSFASSRTGRARIGADAKRGAGDPNPQQRKPEDDGPPRQSGG